MSADEMFKKLGYEKNEFEKEIDYEYQNIYIAFFKEHKTFYKSGGYINMQELQAIYQKCKELGWLGKEN